MARIRSLKPEFWSDPDIIDLPLAARLFFIGCWTYADDYGVLGDEPRRLKNQIFPEDDIDPVGTIDLLVDRRFLLRMVNCEGRNVLVIRSFSNHQKIDRRSPGKWGKPEDFTPAEPRPLPPDPIESPPIPPSPATSPPIPTTDRRGREGIGEEGRGEENTRAANSSSNSLALVPIDPTPAELAEARVSYSKDFEVFWTACPRKKAKGAAYNAWQRAKRKAGIDKLLARMQEDAHAWELNCTDEQYIPHPSKWLNDGRYDDPPPLIRGRRNVSDKQRRTDDILTAFAKGSS